GTLEPRKNVSGLLDAYAALPARVRESHPLLIACAWGWKADALRQKLADRKLAGHVRLLGFMNDSQLAAVYGACTALVWPSFYEGFGLPPLEAMSCGAAVIVSQAASLPEVVDDAGPLLDPADAESWTAAMARMADDEKFRTACRERSMRQAAKFSWRRCVEDTVACYRRALRED
ncbi:MAG: glycosyltransferase family 1 protein, partial [Planctomycetota bacterium]